MAQGPAEYSLQETVDGQTITYDAAGNVTSRNFTPNREGPVETLLFRKKNENAAHIRYVNTHAQPFIKIMVANGAVCNYFINTVDGTWWRNGACSSISGVITDLEIREDTANDPWQTCQWVKDSVYILLQATGSTCTYRFNKLTQRWERICS